MGRGGRSVFRKSVRRFRRERFPDKRESLVSEPRELFNDCRAVRRYRTRPRVYVYSTTRSVVTRLSLGRLDKRWPYENAIMGRRVRAYGVCVCVYSGTLRLACTLIDNKVQYSTDVRRVFDYVSRCGPVVIVVVAVLLLWWMVG